MVFTFGLNGSFGYCSAAPESQQKLGWWSNWPRSDMPEQTRIDPDEARRQLLGRHAQWKDDVIQYILRNAVVDRIYPIWTTPALPHWGADTGAVLLGDSSHTLQAMSGQGACQALEDSIVFSLLLSHYIAESEKSNGAFTTKDAISRSTRGLYLIRKDKVAAIKNRARNLYSKQRYVDNVVLECIYSCFIFAWVKFSFFGKREVMSLIRGEDSVLT